MSLSIQHRRIELVSPSNLAIAALFGFLAVGYTSDWNVLFGRSPRSTVTTRFGVPEHARGRALPSRRLRSGSAFPRVSSQIAEVPLQMINVERLR